MGDQRTNPKGTLLDGVYDSNYSSFSPMKQGKEELQEMLNPIAEELLPHKELLLR